jgi:hypothetical protein
MLYILNSTLLLIHEIESACEKEWEILKLPGKISGFLIWKLLCAHEIVYGWALPKMSIKRCDPRFRESLRNC